MKKKVRMFCWKVFHRNIQGVIDLIKAVKKDRMLISHPKKALEMKATNDSISTTTVKLSEEKVKKLYPNCGDSVVGFICDSYGMNLGMFPSLDYPKVKKVI